MKKMTPDNTPTPHKLAAISEANMEPTGIARKIQGYLRKFESKQITKRIATHIERCVAEDAELADQVTRVYYDTNYGMFHLELTLAGRDYPMRLLLGYAGASARPYTDAAFVGHNPAYLDAAEERNAARQALDDDDYERLCDKIKAYREAVAALRTELEDCDVWPDKYTIEREYLGENTL